MKNIISTDKAPAAVGPYSQAVEANGFIFCSGQIPLMPDGTRVEGDVKAQTRQCLENLKAVLEARFLGLGHVVKCTVLLSDMAYFGDMNEVYGEYFSSDYPARAAFAAKGLPLGVDVEIEAIAIRPA